MKRHSAVIALLVVVMASYYISPAAQAKGTARSRYDHMITLRFKEKWLLPPVQLPSGESAWILDFDRKLRPFSNGQMAADIKKVDMQWQLAPFGPDVLKSRDQARALVELGILSSMGHFAVANAHDDNIRNGAVSIINQLGDIADHYKLGPLKSQYDRLATDVADPKFIGGPSPILGRYDATVAELYDFVAASFGIDGHWYFMFGNTLPGEYVLGLHGDQLHMQYFLEVQDDLFHSKPRLFPDYYTRATLRDFDMEPQRDSEYIANMSWATMNHFITGSNYYADPRNPHYDPEWNRIYLP